MASKLTKDGEPFRFYCDVVLPYDGDECLIWPYGRTGRGYARVRADGKEQYVYRLLCEERDGPPPTPKHQAAHSCGKGRAGCVNKRHVRWATRSENEADKVLHGTSNRGSRQGGARLTEADVLKIKSMKGQFTTTEIARQFGVARMTIGCIFNGRSWRHVG